jgi:type IV pilus assembly protein PilE
MQTNRREAGFSLVELVVTVAIAGILTSLAIPAYRQYTMRANRVDAKSALLRLASNQERFYLQNNTYATDAQRPLAPPNGLGIAGTENGYYALAVQAPAAGPFTQGFTATATVAAASRQRDDTQCWQFSINEQGQKQAFTQGGADNTATCWR